ncbi:MAG: HK97 family phage prohead protease [Thermaurantiacus sp.]
MSGHVTISGYVSRFHTPDASGDIVRPQAFLGNAADVPLLWQHDLGRPIGRVTRLTEDAGGLSMEARIDPNCRDGADALALIRSGAVDGLSFGFRAKKARALPGGGRELLAIDLLECSVVTLPMHRQARILTLAP